MAKLTKKKEEQLVINQVVVQAPQRRVYDVGDWRSAMRSADIGRVKPLYDLFEEILIDGVLADAIDKRTEAVLSAGVTFVDAQGEEIEEVTDLINSSAGETMLRSILAQRFYGRSGFEISFADGFTCQPFKPKYIDLQHKAILLNDVGDKSVSYADNSQILILGQPLDYGLLLKAAPFAVYKRGGFGDYAQWIELFGMPQRIGKYNTYDPASRALLEEAFKNAGSAPYLIIPKESDIETREGSSGSGTSYDEFRKACNEEMLITILGQTLTTVQGERGARSLGEVHMEVEQNKHKGDVRFVERVLNERVIPMLEARGFNLQGGRFMFPREAEPLTVADIVNLSEIIQIPAAFVHDKYGIPMPKDGEQIARKQTQEVIEVQKTVDPPKKEGAKTVEKIRNNDERSFLQRMWDFFVGAPQVGAMMSGTALTMTDAKTLDERLIARTPNEKGFDTELFEYLSNDLIKAFREGWDSETELADKASIALQYSIEDDALKTAMEINLYRFSAAKTLAEVQALNQLFRESSSYADFEKKASAICPKFNKTWQRTEYETAFNAAQSASRYQQLIRKAKVFPYWEYRATHDGRTRPEHMKLDGVVLPAGDKLWDQIYPPNGWNCRCRVKPLGKDQFKGSFEEMRDRVGEFLKSEEWTRAMDGGWDINRAKQGLVFDANQFYVNTLSRGNQKILSSLNHADYGLPTIEERIEAAKEHMPLYKGTAKEWYANNPILTDYWGRKIEVPQVAFSNHTTPDYKEKGRVDLLDAIIDAIKNPAEVWVNDYTKGDKTNINFIKFYHGKMINVVCRLNNLQYSIATWYEVFLSEKTRHRYRRGLLIKK